MSDGTWQRDYQYGTVVVDPSTQTAHIDLETRGKTCSPRQTPKVTTTVKQATPTPKSYLNNGKIRDANAKSYLNNGKIRDANAIADKTAPRRQRPPRRPVL